MKKTSKEDHIAWAKKAYANLKSKHEKPIKFRSKLEERIADLLEGLGVSYEYESTRFLIPSSIIIALISVSQITHTSKQKDTGLQKTDAKSLQLRRTIPI